MHHEVLTCISARAKEKAIYIYINIYKYIYMCILDRPLHFIPGPNLILRPYLILGPKLILGPYLILGPDLLQTVFNGG